MSDQIKADLIKAKVRELNEEIRDVVRAHQLQVHLQIDEQPVDMNRSMPQLKVEVSRRL